MPSRVARKPITIPKGVEVKVTGQTVDIKGPKGKFVYEVPASVSVSQQDNNLLVAVSENLKGLHVRNRASLEKFSGTTRANLHNLIAGAAEDFTKKLVLKGVGYRAQVQGKKLNLSLGFSHPVEMAIPEGIVIEAPSQTELTVKGPNKHLVGQVAANIRAVRPVEPYKGKGVRYHDEVVILKETKKK